MKLPLLKEEEEQSVLKQSEKETSQQSKEGSYSMLITEATELPVEEEINEAAAAARTELSADPEIV